MPTLCDLYARVSSTEQAEEGYSLREQEDRLRAYAVSQGWTVHACYVDPGFSGSNLMRPGIQAVIDDATHHRVQKVVTYKLDRLSRSQKDVLYLIEDIFKPNGVDYVSMTEAFDTGTPVDMATIGVMAVFAQLERQQIEERMMVGRIASAKEGNWRGGSGVPLGYKYIPKTANEAGRLVVEECEAQIVRSVFEQFLTGKTFHAIYVWCAERYGRTYGRFGSGGSAIIPAMLSNRVYIGEIKYCGKWYPGKHEPIISRELFDRVQAAMAEYRDTLDHQRRRPFKAGHMLTGFLYCGECGARWCYHSCAYTRRTTGERVIYGTYCCYTKNSHRGQRRADHCSLPVWPSRELEQVVIGQIRDLRVEDFIAKSGAAQAEVEALDARISAVDRKIEKTIDLYVNDGIISAESLHKRVDALNEEKQKLQTLREAAASRLGRQTPAEVLAVLQNLDEILSGPEDGIRDMLTLLIRRITLGKDRAVTIEWNL